MHKKKTPLGVSDWELFPQDLQFWAKVNFGREPWKSAWEFYQKCDDEPKIVWSVDGSIIIKDQVFTK